MSSPSARDTQGMTYDAAHGEIVLFGGFNGSDLSDTWLWNGTSWNQATPATAPSARSNVQMVYDAAHGNVVLFGGLFGNSTRYGDTWIWNGSNWAQQSPAHTPPARASGGMVYDAATGNVVLFGGLSGSGSFLGDTWIWNGSDWTQANPATSPSARFSPGMAYDAAHSQVLLFGGNSSAVEVNDTWTWDGSTWTQLSPANQPSARDSVGMDYDAAQGQVVLFGGVNNLTPAYFGDTWAWNGANWIQENPPASPAARLAPESLIYDPAQGELILFGGTDNSSVYKDTWAWGIPSDFGGINVCPSGQSTPAPCSNTLSLTYNLPETTSFGTNKAVTQGSAGLDFTLASGSTCTGTVQGGNSCTVNVAFTPTAPGLRMGAVQLFDNLGNLVITSMVYGVGEGPAIAFGPGAQSALIGTGGLFNPTGVAVDAAGDVFVADSDNNRVLELPVGGGPQTVVPATGLNSPWGVAVDGAGDLFIGDTGNNRVVEVTPSGVQTTVPTTGLNNPLGVAVDGAGDLFIADDYNNQVVEIPAGCTTAGCQTTVASGLNNPNGVAVDAVGDVFIVDSSSQLVEIPAGCTAAACQIQVGNGFSNPRGVAVDAAGDVFVGDTYNSRVVEIPAGCTAAACQIQVGSGFGYPKGVGLDGAGDLFVADSNDGQLDEVNRSQPPVLNFATTYVGYASSDSPQSFNIQNIGNQPLDAVAPGLLVTGPNFFQVPGTRTPPDCTSSFALTPGADCNVSITFEPQMNTSGSSAAFTDNALNVNPAMQVVVLSGTGLEPPVMFTLIGAGTGNGSVSSSPSGINCNVLGGIASGACSASYPDGAGISLEEVPTAGYTFAGWGGACASSGTSQFCNITLNATSSASASFVPTPNYTLTVTEVGTGSGTVTDNLAQISCSETNGAMSGTCSGSYLSGTMVTLTAASSGGSIFAGWGGDCASFGASATCTLTVNSALNATASFVAPGASQPGALKPITAGVVYGQGGNLSIATQNNGGVSASSLNNPMAMAFDASGDLYVADRSNNRVLFYPAGSTTATRVYGQNGSFTTNTANNGGVSANSLSQPWAVALDNSGNLYVADNSNNRVLFYPAGSTTATRVYGQGGSFATNAGNNGGVSANGLTTPAGLAVDSGGDLYVSDGNHRVLFFPAGNTTATRVYGQGGSFSANTVDNGGVSANSLANPQGLALDSGGDLYVADLYDNRVLFYPYNSTTATRVYGQNGSFTTNAANNGGVSANSLSQPQGLAVDSGGNLYVTGYGDSRVLFYPFGSTTATRVYGQGGSFTANAVNNGGISANSLRQPTGVALDSSGNLYVADIYNNRVLEYGSFGNVNVCPSGQGTPAPCSSTIALSYYAATNTTFGGTQVVTQGATGLDFSLASGGTCTGTVTAGNACTVNATFTPSAPGSRLGAASLYDNNGNLIANAPIYGLGQGPVSAFSPSTQATVGTGSFPLSNPRGLLIDAVGNLFISDADNLQVLKVAPNGSVSTVGFGFQFPQGMAEDGAGNLYIADNNLNQVVEVPAGCASSACQINVPNPLNLRSQLGVAADGAGDLFIGDFLDHEVAKVSASGGAQTIVYNPTPGCNTLPCSDPVDLTADAAGDLFIADYGLQAVVEIPAGCTIASCQITIGSGWSQPDGVAVDAAGDVFVADAGLNEVVEVPAGCTTSACQIVMVSGVQTVAVKVDAAGDVFVDNLAAKQVFEIIRSQPPSLGFPLTNVASTSTPQSVSIQNVGNQTLTGSVALSLGANFLNGTSNCGTGFSLAPGASCSESFMFTPQNTGAFTGTATFSDNTFNLSPLVVSQAVNLSGIGGLNGQAVAMIVPDVVGMTQTGATSAITGAGLTLGAVSSGYSDSEPAGSVTGSSPAAGTAVNPGSAVAVRLSIGAAPTPASNPLSFETNYFVTGDYATAGVTLHGVGTGGVATGTITIPDSTTSPGSQGVPDGADIIDGFLYWETLESSTSPSGNTGTFLGYSITGQQIGSDVPYTDGSLSGTLRVYRADVNNYFQDEANGSRLGSGPFTVTLPGNGGTGPTFAITEGTSLVVIYRVLSPNFPLKSVVIYDGSAIPTAPTPQNIQGFYDAVGGQAEIATLNYASGSWNGTPASLTLGADASSYTSTLNAGSPYAAVILSTPVANSDNDGILNAWKTGPPAGDFFTGQPGYYDVKSNSWVALPGAKRGEKDLFVQLDYMCGAVLSNGACDPTQENLYPSPDPNGNDPLLMVQQAFANTGIVLHLQIGNAVPESTCTDSQGQLCQFPGEPGVIGWKNSLEYSKVWPRNFTSCAAGGDCTARFPYGQKDSYHYVLFGHSLAIPAWNSRYGSLSSITVSNGVTTIVTTDRGTRINACPSRITISGVLGDPNLNGVYNTSSCPDTKTMIVATPGLTTNWSYTYGTSAEPAIGITSGTVTSISGYSDLGGADSAVTLALWETAPNQDMSKRANVIAGTLFHEIGHTLGLSHGGLYYDSSPSYVPNFEVNCKPNYQSIMNYLFQLDGVGPNGTVAYSNQTLTELFTSSLNTVTQLTDTDSGSVGSPASFSTSSWYTSSLPVGSTESPATLHCDGTPLNGDTGYRVNAPISSTTPLWPQGGNIAFDGVTYTQMRGFNDVANIDLRQVGATGGEFSSLAGVLNFNSASTAVNVAAGGNVTLGSGGTVTLGSGGNVTLGSGGNVTLGSGGTITPGNGGTVTLNNGGTATLSTGGIVTLGSGGNVTLGSGGNVTLGSAGIIALGSGGNVTLGSGGNVTLGSGGIITSSAGTVTIPSAGGTYTLPSGGGIIALGSGGTIALGSGGNVTLGSGGTITLGSGGNVTLGSGGNIALGSGGNVTLGSGGTIALGSGGNVTLGSGGNVTLGSGGNVTLGSGGNVTLGSGGNVTLGSGGNVTLGSGGNVTLGSGGTVTLGSGGNVTLGSGGTVTLGSGGNVTLGSGGTITLGSGGIITMGSGGNVTLGSGGATINGVAKPAGTYPVSSGGIIALGSGGNVTLGSGGNVTLGSGGNITLGSGGTITLGSGGTVTLGSGGNVTLGSGGNVTLGSGGTIALGSGGNIALGSGGNVTLGSGGVTTTELTYEIANSIVRPPPSATYTVETAGVQVNWTAPAFGVVEAYTISRSVNGGTPVVIGTVSGVNGNPPATTFTDTNPPASGTVVYTIATMLVPDQGTSTSRQSAPSPPAVLTLNQTIAFSPALPSSVVISNSPYLVTAYAETTGGTPVPLQVNFNATGSCSIASQGFNSTNNSSTASINLSTTGSCTISASQPGFISSQTGGTSYNAATPASSTFVIVAQNSHMIPQTITFPQLPNLRYGTGFTLNASSNFGAPITYTVSGPCTTSGTTTGIGVCTIMASAPSGSGPNNSTYNAVSVSQSFTVFQAVINVTAASFTIPYGQTVPTLTYTLTGFVNGDSTSVVTGKPVLSTTATSTSSPSVYPISATTGTLAATNYSFVPVPGTLTIQQSTATISISNIPTSAVYGGSFMPTYSYTGIGTPTESVMSNSTGVCTVSGNLVSYVGAGTCSLTASAGATTDDLAATGSTQTFTVGQASATISISNIPTSAMYGGGFTPTYTYSGIGTPTESVMSNSTSVCTVSSGTVKFVGVGTCSLTASATATTDDLAATGSTQTFTVGQASATISISNIPASAVYGGSFTPTYSYSGIGTPTESVMSNSASVCTVSSGTVKFVGVGTCSLTASATATTDDKSVTGSPQTFTVGQAAQTITFTSNPPTTAAYNSSFTVAATASSSLAVTFTSSGSCSNSGATYTMTSSTGTCSVIANQAGNANFTAAPTVTKAVSASGPMITVSPTSINFGTVYLDSVNIRSITVSNTGTAAATISTPLVSLLQAGNSNEFVAVNLCPSSLAAGKSCAITIGFYAGAYYSTAQTGMLKIMDSAPGSPQVINLTAMVIDPLASFSPTSLSFGTVKHASGSSSLNVTLSNTGATPLIFSGAGISITGNNATSFSQTNGCGTSLAAGAKCTIAVKFAPATTGKFSASLTVVDNAQAGSGTQTVALSGTGN